MTITRTVAHPSTSTQNASRNWSRRLALGAVAGPVLFTLAWLILGALSPGYTVSGTWISPYSAISQPISGLGLGETARYMNTAFVISGLLLLAGVIGVARTLPPDGRPVARIVSAILLGLAPVGLIIIGLFTLETPVRHLAGAMLVLATPVVSFFVTGLYLRAFLAGTALATGCCLRQRSPSSCSSCTTCRSAKPQSPPGMASLG